MTFSGAVAYTVKLHLDCFLKAKNSDFCIKKVEFDGNERVSDVLLLKTSGLKYKSNIFSHSVQDVKDKLESITWIKSATVQRKLPDTIYVRVAERTPIAILQSKYKLYLIDQDGKILENDGVGNFGNLPIVVGEGAEKEFDQLLRCLDRFHKIRKQLVFAVRIGRRRWNIKINKGITVKLPESGVMHALGILEEISDDNGFFNEDIESIDLRMLDRVIVTKKNK
ncbi:MAG: FtsQ-type POTRA domain-containing protein [Holosporaceae bacterium]|jgi:cell division protein FtsQ|nr:FtsQ-type POTRA domain-containing protein [Holosporaceae bacterium]